MEHEFTPNHTNCPFAKKVTLDVLSQVIASRRIEDILVRLGVSEVLVC